MPVDRALLEKIAEDVEAVTQEYDNTLGMLEAHSLNAFDMAEFSYTRGRMVWKAMDALHRATGDRHSQAELLEHACAGLWTDGFVYGMRCQKELDRDSD